MNRVLFEKPAIEKIEKNCNKVLKSTKLTFNERLDIFEIISIINIKGDEKDGNFQEVVGEP